MSHTTARMRLQFFTALAICGIIAVSAESGWTAEAFKMGVVDPQAVLERSKAGRRALDGLKDQQASREKLLAKDADEIKVLEGQLKAQENSANDPQKQEQFRAKIQDYQKRVQEFNQRLQGFQQEMAIKQKDMVDEYMKKIQIATKVVAERNKISLVVDKGSDSTIKIVLYNKDTLDLTEQVIKEFDKLNK